MSALQPVPVESLVRVFERDGFIYDRQEGEHRIYVKAGLNCPLVIPVYRAVPVFVIRNLLRASGMSRDRYFELLTS
jgi:predicted RNA binding protein YcfA (HicA-like mRNA interferase family)